MTKFKFILGIAIILIASSFAMYQSVDWKLNEDAYSVKITCKKFDGVFKGLKTNIQFDENNLAGSKISATIDATTVNTGNGLRNKHAKQGLDAAHFNTINFESTSISKTTTGFEAKGKLTIKNVTKEISLPFTFINKGSEGIFNGNFSVKPKDYSVEKSGTPNEIQIILSIPVNK
jgi:polyisoprenoid-binding protein YceI